MMVESASRPGQVGLFFNLAGERRAQFQAASGEQFGRLLLADTAEVAGRALARQKVDGVDARTNLRLPFGTVAATG